MADNLFLNSGGGRRYGLLLLEGIAPNGCRGMIERNLFYANNLTVPEPGRYRIVLYDVGGREVRQIFDGAVVLDRHVSLQAGDLASGVYFARALNTATHRPVVTAKLVLLR